MEVVKPLQVFNRFGMHRIEAGTILKVVEKVSKEHPVDAYVAGVLLRLQPDKVRIKDGPKIVDAIQERAGHES